LLQGIGLMQTEILAQVYQFIVGYIREEGMSPTQGEIAKGCNLSSEKTLDALSILEARGKIERSEGEYRNIRIPTPTGD
jgi:SOS-response transcriptional repressor LexA